MPTDISELSDLIAYIWTLLGIIGAMLLGLWRLAYVIAKTKSKIDTNATQLSTFKGQLKTLSDNNDDILTQRTIIIEHERRISENERCVKENSKDIATIQGQLTKIK